NSNQQYTIPPVASATSYYWTVPTGYKIVSGQGTATLVVTIPKQKGVISVYAINSCGRGASANLTISPGGRCKLSADEQNILSDDFKVYPNPTHGLTKISFISNKSTTYSLRLLDITGRLLKDN